MSGRRRYRASVTDYHLHRQLPELTDPLLVVMLTGWIDAAGAAEAAFASLSAACNAEPLCNFDTDAFIDYRARRPTMELRDGVNTRLVWPQIVLSTGRTPEGRDIVLLGGPEPDSQWHRFCNAVTELAVSLGVVRMIGFGAYPFSAPHTRQPRLSCTAPSRESFAGMAFLTSSLDIPAGVMAALEQALHAADIPCLGMWVQVPHYVAAMPYPAASVALLDMLRQLTGVGVPTDELAAAALAQRQRIDELIQANPEHVAMLHQLELAHDEATSDVSSFGADLPSADQLAAEVERFLRDRTD